MPRSLTGTLLIIAWIALYSLVVIVAFDFVLRWPVPVQGLFFLVAGIAWILPLKPLLRWIETGHFRG